MSLDVYAYSMDTGAGTHRALERALEQTEQENDRYLRRSHHTLDPDHVDEVYTSQKTRPWVAHGHT